jgi:hypothetical protein
MGRSCAVAVARRVGAGRPAELEALLRSVDSPPPHLRRDWAWSCPICTGTAYKSLVLVGLAGSSRQPSCGARCARCAAPCAHADPFHICTGTGLTPSTSAPGLGPPLPHLRRDRAHPCHIRPRTGLEPAASLLCINSGACGPRRAAVRTYAMIPQSILFGWGRPYVRIPLRADGASSGHLLVQPCRGV